MATKLELTAQRVQLIERLGTTKEPTELVEIQAELTSVNRQLKTMNIADAEMLHIQAQQRALRRQVNNDENLSRAGLKVGVPIRPESGGATTLGEMIIVRAKQLAKLLDNVPAGTSLPHTDAFVPQLEAFILQQKQHLKTVASTRAPNAGATKPTDWQETWKDVSKGG